MAGQLDLALNQFAMVDATYRILGLRLLGATFVGALIGAFLGVASAQDRSAGALDQICVADCARRGYAAEFCNQVCWIPDPNMAARGSMINWTCMTDCRARGGREEDCRSQCRRR